MVRNDRERLVLVSSRPPSQSFVSLACFHFLSATKKICIWEMLASFFIRWQEVKTHSLLLYILYVGLPPDYETWIQGSFHGDARLVCTGPPPLLLSPSAQLSELMKFSLFERTNPRLNRQAYTSSRTHTHTH